MTFRLRSFFGRIRASARKTRWKTRETINSIGPDAALGSRRWLVQREVKYGGIVTDVPRGRVSVNDPRSSDELKFGGMIGGDRMLHHNYAPVYAEYLAPYLGRSDVTVVEVGILQGTGLAIWCDLFPDARVIGLDVDLSHFIRNRHQLERCGAFACNTPEVHVFDQLSDGNDRLSEILNGDEVDIMIDDGLHSPEAILNTLKAFYCHRASDSVAFIEDIGADALPPKNAEFDVRSYGEIHVLKPKSEPRAA